MYHIDIIKKSSLREQIGKYDSVTNLRPLRPCHPHHLITSRWRTLRL